MASDTIKNSVKSLKTTIKGMMGRDTDDSLGKSYPDFEPQAIATIEGVRPYTMTSPERVYALIQAVKYIVAAGLPGDFVECGVWKGGSMMTMAQTLLRLGDTSRRLHLFDTFEGMPPATDCDRDFRGNAAADLLSAAPDREKASIWAMAQLDEVQANLGRTNYPISQIHYVQGKVEDTLPEKAPSQIALLRLDTDWYESTRHEMEHLYPRLARGGVLIVDDYGYWQGARKAIDEYLAAHKIHLLLHRIDRTGRIAIKP
jgi:hypothetical protein